MEQCLFLAINAVRDNPHSIVDQIKGQLSRFETKHIYRTKHDTKLRACSGKEAWQECVMSLDRQKSKNRLEYSVLLQQIAKGHSPLSAKRVCKGAYAEYRGVYDKTLDMQEMVAAMVVGDADQKKEGRVAMFHPSYCVFGCGVEEKGGKVYVTCIFAEEVGKQQKEQEQEEINVCNKGSGSGDTPKGNTPMQPQHDPHLRGSQFLAQMNRIRKEPKQYIHTIKRYIDSFKDQTTLVIDNLSLTVKQGQTPLYQLISELETQYTLPSLRENAALVAISAFQMTDLMKEYEKRVPHEVLLQRHCAQSQGVKSMRLREVKGWSIEAIVLRMMMDDGDKKRTNRKKLMSPICKVAGCVVNGELAVINVGESCKGIHINIIAEKSNIIAEKKNNIIAEKKNNIIAEKKSNGFDKHTSDGRIVVKRTKKTKKGELEGRQCWVTQIQTVYQSGEVQTVYEEQVIKQ